MVDDNPNNITSSKGQYLWRQRIAKERAHFRPSDKADFSVRSALRILDVPGRFKPGQINPHDQGPVQGLDSVTERLLRADVAAKHRVPAEQLLWPETEQHQVGWLAKANGPGLPYEERSTMSGLSPRLGIGWMHGDAQPAKVAGLAHQPLLPAVVQSPRAALKEDLISKWTGMRQDVRSETAQVPSIPALPPPVPQVPTPKNRRQVVQAEVQARWQVLQENWEEQKQKRRERRRLKMAAPNPQAPATSAPTPAATRLPPLSRLGKVFAPAACAGFHRAEHLDPEDAWGGEAFAVVPRPSAREDRQVAAAADRGRNFMNRPGNPWFKPKGSSDVVAFGNAYAKSWGKSVFCRKAPIPPSAPMPMPSAAAAAAAPGPLPTEAES